MALNEFTSSIYGPSSRLYGFITFVNKVKKLTVADSLPACLLGVGGPGFLYAMMPTSLRWGRLVTAPTAPAPPIA